MNLDQKLTAEEAHEYLQKRFTPINEITKKMACFETDGGRQIGLNLEGKKVTMFVEPGDWTLIVPGVELIRTYAKRENDSDKEGRHHHLKSNAPRLSAEYPAMYLSIPTMAVLAAFCDAYGESKAPPAGQSPSESTQTQIINSTERNLCMNTILYGPPGTGKTYKTTELAVRICEKDVAVPETKFANDEPLKARYEELRNEGRISFVTFHQSYGYEDFIEGLRPELKDGQVSYRVRPGIFREACAAVANSPSQNHVLIIDEINRANISKVFGELITLLEPDKREGQTNAITVKLPYSGDSFSVPSNLYVIGTMNTADRSIALLDTALRRRFEFEEMQPDYEALSANLVEGLNIRAILQAMNDRIEYLYDRDHTIGHAYFMNVKTLADLDSVFRRKVIPLLQEYFYENWSKVLLVLNEKGGGFINVNNDLPKGLESINEGFEPRPRYQIMREFNASAYRNIYQ